MHIKIEGVLNRIKEGKIKTACIYELIDTYYQNVVWRIDEIDGFDNLPENPPFPEEFFQSVDTRVTGIGEAIEQLLKAGYDIDEPEYGFNALMLAVGEGDAPMVRYLISHGADANTWPGIEGRLPFERNYYLDDIDIHYMDKCFDRNCDPNYVKAFYHTALVLAEDAHLGPYYGFCLEINESGKVSLDPPRLKY